MTLDLRPELAEGLKALAAAHGLSIEGYLQQLVERELAPDSAEPAPSEGSGMVLENGLLVYKTGRPLPAHVVDDAIQRSREERSRHILGDHS